MRLWAKKKKPAKVQIPDFFSASKDNLQIYKKSRGSQSVPSAIACPCVTRYWAKKKKPVKVQIPDFFSASKDNLQIYKKSRGSQSVPSPINCPCVVRSWAKHSQIKAIAKFIGNYQPQVPTSPLKGPTISEVIQPP